MPTLVSFKELLSYDMDFEERGVALRTGGAAAVLHDLLAIAGKLPDRPGERLWNVAGLGALLCAEGPIGAIAASGDPGNLRPVRAILFNKSAANNWSLAWHQDRTIVVRRRIECAGFGPWTIKRQLQHVAPPMTVLNEMVTVRVHLDAVSAENAPLLVAPGSHLLGRIEEAGIPAVVAQCGVLSCLAEPGDIWRYATPILHASQAATLPRQRRVLQVDYAADDLPSGLEWLGLGD